MKILLIASIIMCAAISEAQLSGPAECFKAAVKLWKPALTKDQAIRLCKGAPNVGPALCAQYAANIWQPAMTPDDCVDACVRAPNIEPARCVEQVYGITNPSLTKAEAIDLCVTPVPCKKPLAKNLIR